MPSSTTQKRHQLSGADREFFRLVYRAAFINPFSQTRTELDREIGGVNGRVSKDNALGAAVLQVLERVDRLRAEGKADFRRYGGEDGEILRIAFLFEIYHRFMEDFDRLIVEQVDSGDNPIQVPFAREALVFLRRRGFDREESLRFLAIFFQLRRAFYFIDQGLIGQCPCMTKLRLHLWENVFTHDIRLYDRHLWNRMEDFSTLLLGETGTGKGTAAAAIGRSGFIPFDEKKECFTESFTRNFISLNLSQYPVTLIESELFGHRKGAFTGAVDHYEGVFARCSPHGAIFLDEIGDVSVPVQIKLLQVLQDRTFSPVGSHERLRFHGRVIAATNHPLEEMRREGHFRDDFYYRLCSDIIVVPPLRQRIREDPAEFDLLIRHLVVRMTGETAADLVALVRDAIAGGPGADYRWSGNVRELEQAVRRILLTRHYRGDRISGAGDLQSETVRGLVEGSLDAQELISAYCALLYERLGTYEAVARRTQLDRRTVKKYIERIRDRRAENSGSGDGASR